MSGRRYRIAGVPIEFSSEPDLPFPLPPGYAPFATDPTGPAAARFHLTRENAVVLPPLSEAQAVWTSAQWSLYRYPSGHWRFDARANPADFQHPVAWIGPDFSDGFLFPRRRGTDAFRAFPFCFPIDEQLLLLLLARHGVALVHGCSFDLDGRAILACGRSGAGKSTLARLARQHGARLLNDDRTLLRVDANGQAWASASPWHGEESEVNPEPLPLGVACVLRQSTETRFTPCPPADALSHLLANAIAPFHVAASLDAVTDTLARIAARVPVGILAFRPDENALAALAEPLRGVDGR
jgi:hypothetical protein